MMKKILGATLSAAMTVGLMTGGGYRNHCICRR